jgi:hypothetical protein
MFAAVSHWLAKPCPGSYAGVSVADVDGDGRCEVLLAGAEVGNVILRWDGTRLWDIAPRSLKEPSQRTLTMIAADVDGDGREELYLQNSGDPTQPVQLQDRLMDHEYTTGLWYDLFAQPRHTALRNAAPARGVVALDRRGQGRYGVLVGNVGRPLRLYELNPTGGFVDIAPALGLAESFQVRGMWAGPLFSERTDLVITADAGRNRALRNTGLGTFLELATELNLDDSTEHSRGVVVFDANDDGKLDVAWASGSGPHRLMFRQPDGSFLDRASPAWGMPCAVGSLVVADFDNDGYEEVFFNCTDTDNRLFRHTESGYRQTDPGEALLPECQGSGAVAVDLDGDGQLELVVAHYQPTGDPVRIFKPAMPVGHWLRVMPRTRFGAPARGALVRLCAGGRVQTRVICGGSGYLCQGEPIAHFGLGSNTQIDWVRVTWPDGAHWSLSQPRSCTLIEPNYPAG